LGKPAWHGDAALLFACVDVDYSTQVDTVIVDVVVGPPPVGRTEVVEPANRLHPRRPLITFPYRLYPVADTGREV
jgi:hypothetical protein